MVQIGMGVRTNIPIIGSTAIVQGFDMQEMLRNFAGRLSIQKEAWNDVFLHCDACGLTVLVTA
jgi:hypothetical protein